MSRVSTIFSVPVPRNLSRKQRKNFLKSSVTGKNPRALTASMLVLLAGVGMGCFLRGNIFKNMAATVTQPLRNGCKNFKNWVLKGRPEGKRGVQDAASTASERMPENIVLNTDRKNVPAQIFKCGDTQITIQSPDSGHMLPQDDSQKLVVNWDDSVDKNIAPHKNPFIAALNIDAKYDHTKKLRSKQIGKNGKSILDFSQKNADSVRVVGFRRPVIDGQSWYRKTVDWDSYKRVAEDMVEKIVSEIAQAKASEKPLSVCLPSLEAGGRKMMGKVMIDDVHRATRIWAKAIRNATKNYQLKDINFVFASNNQEEEKAYKLVFSQ